MINEKALCEFVEPYYIDKDIMHNMWHIELVKKMIFEIISIYVQAINMPKPFFQLGMG